MDSLDDRRAISALAILLHEELREARFHVSHLALTEAELLPNQSVGATSTRHEPTFVETLDADGLKALHDKGEWKQNLYRSEIRVKALPGGPESVARRTRLELFLDELDIVSEGHVVHTLAPLLPVYTFPNHPLDSPEAIFGLDEVEELWRYFLVDACLHRPRDAASKVVRWARGARLDFETRVLLGRLDTAEPFALANGLAVERLPRKSRDLGGLLPVALGFPSLDYLGRTLLRIPCTVAALLTNPPVVTAQSAGARTRPWQKTVRKELKPNWPLPSGGIYDLSRALSLVCDVAVETPLIWTDYGEHAHFGRRHGVSNMGTGEPLPRSATQAPLTADSLKEALRFQRRLRSSPTGLETAVRYWLKSKARGVDIEDALVFLRTALEALFLPEGNRDELAFRLAINGAWYTGRNRAERRERYDVLTEVYRAASGAVHGGTR